MLPVNSEPTMIDSDGDELDDAKDNVPLINYTYNLKKCTNDCDLFNIYWTNYEIDEYGNRIYLLNLPNKVSKDETEALVYGFITTHLEEMEK